MRQCPQWFTYELTRIGGVNQYGEPIFKLVWSTEPRRVIGGQFPGGFTGYKQRVEITGEPAWALMVWEPVQAWGSLERWERDYRDLGTGLLDCGPYPKYGRYRLLQKFVHREVVQQPVERCWMSENGTLCRDIVRKLETRAYRMEPCGLLLDLMVPMLAAWRKLSDQQKVTALKQAEAQEQEKFIKMTKDAIDGTKLSRTMRSWQLVQKRAEIIERGMKQAMQMAAHYGLGMRSEA